LNTLENKKIPCDLIAEARGRDAAKKVAPKQEALNDFKIHIVNNPTTKYSLRSGPQEATTTSRNM
jgi:hypothetical protein